MNHISVASIQAQGSSRAVCSPGVAEGTSLSKVPGRGSVDFQGAPAEREGTNMHPEALWSHCLLLGKVSRMLTLLCLFFLLVWTLYILPFLCGI